MGGESRALDVADAVAPECRFAIHRRADGVRVGRIQLRLTDDATILRAVGHAGYILPSPRS